MRLKLLEFKDDFIIPIYESQVSLVFTTSVYQTIKKHNVENPTEFKDAEGGTILTSHPTIIFKRIPTINTVVHETSHAAEIILITRGVEPKGEQRAYLEGFIAEKVEEIKVKAERFFRKNLAV